MKKIFALILVLSMILALSAVSASAEDNVYSVAYLVNGNLGELVKNIRAVSRETCCDGNMVLPYLAADGVVISGK